MSFVGSTPFYNAARNGDPAMMKLLVEHGADPKMATPLGLTPLMAAACIDYYEGETPGPLTGVSEAERLEAVKLAWNWGTTSTPKRISATIRWWAHRNRCSRTIRTTLTILPTSARAMRAGMALLRLHGAVLCNQPSILQYLLDKGADPTIKSRLGWTPYTLTQGIFMANSKKEFPVAAQILQKALASKGQTVASRE